VRVYYYMVVARHAGAHLEDVEQGLRGLEDLHVRRLRLLDRLVVLVPRLHLARQRLINLRQPVRQDGQVLLDLGLLLQRPAVMSTHTHAIDAG